MILDTLDRLCEYSVQIPYLDLVLKFLEVTDLGSLEEGRIVLSDNDLFVNVNNQKAQTRNQVPIEAHRQYIDIQIPVSNDEEMGFMPAAFLPEASVPYKEESDIEFFPGPCDTYLNVRKGMFVAFFPGEGHAPAITETGVRKIVIKIRK